MMVRNEMIESLCEFGAEWKEPGGIAWLEQSGFVEEWHCADVVLDVEQKT
jgi:hypothetical protein